MSNLYSVLIVFRCFFFFTCIALGDTVYVFHSFSSQKPMMMKGELHKPHTCITNTVLFKMIVGVLTTCHTQYT